MASLSIRPHLESFAALVVVSVVKGLNIKEHREAVIFPRLGALKQTKLVFLSYKDLWKGPKTRRGRPH